MWLAIAQNNPPRPAQQHREDLAIGGHGLGQFLLPASQARRRVADAQRGVLKHIVEREVHEGHLTSLSFYTEPPRKWVGVLVVFLRSHQTNVEFKAGKPAEQLNVTQSSTERHHGESDSKIKSYGQHVPYLAGSINTVSGAKN